MRGLAFVLLHCVALAHAAVITPGNVLPRDASPGGIKDWLHDKLSHWLDKIHGDNGTVALPSNDAFYVPPRNISAYAPGDIIRSRRVTANLNGLLGNKVPLTVAASYQLLYRTTDSLGMAVGSMATVLVPRDGDGGKLLAYQTAYDSANNDCSPSFALQSGADTTATGDIPFIAAALERGWYVVSADYSGLDAHVVAGVQAGHATLDAVRAALNHAPTSGLSSSARHAMWGYSSGSIASGFAAELASSYAPELEFVGAALGGVIANVTSSLLAINKGPSAGLAFSGIYGFSKAYPNLTAHLDEHFKADKKAEFLAIANGCLDQAHKAGRDRNVFSYFESGEQVLQDPVPRSVLSRGGQMGLFAAPSMPLYLYKAQGDQVSPTADTDALVNEYCSQGASVEYRANTIGGHTAELFLGGPCAFDWLDDRLNGIPVANQGSCVRRMVTVSRWDKDTIKKMGKLFSAAWKAVFGGDLGPDGIFADSAFLHS